MKALEVLRVIKSADQSHSLTDSTLVNLICYAFGVSRSAVYANVDINASEKELNRISYLVSEGTPFAYIVGKESFYTRDFYILPGVFIPRNETELLVEATKESNFQDFLEFGSGSGAISITLLLENTACNGSAVEISHVGQLCTEYNAQKFAVSNRLTILNTLPKIGAFDLIISNPPYVDFRLWNEVDSTVKKYEPLQAIFPQDPLSIYRRLLRYGCSHLSEDGRLIFEIDDSLSYGIRELCLAMGFVCEVRKDLSNIDRVAIVKKK
jgi:release factor glutamine methyltransferase